MALEYPAALCIFHFYIDNTAILEYKYCMPLCLNSHEHEMKEMLIPYTRTLEVN